MNAGWPVATAWALGNDAVVAGLAALAVSPGGHALIAIVLERRPVHASREFTALIIGDPLLALAVCIGVALSPRGASAAMRPVLLGTGAVLIACSWLFFGLWQWRTEFRRGYYSCEQAFAPTKIWHQLVVYPLLGSLVCCSVLSGLAAPIGSPVVLRLLGKVAIVILVLGWVAANLYDRRHAKLGHPPYSWRELRTLAEPWPADSRTLQSYWINQI